MKLPSRVSGARPYLNRTPINTHLNLSPSAPEPRAQHRCEYYQRTSYHFILRATASSIHHRTTIFSISSPDEFSASGSPLPSSVRRGRGNSQTASPQFSASIAAEKTTGPQRCPNNSRKKSRWPLCQIFFKVWRTSCGLGVNHCSCTQRSAPLPVHALTEAQYVQRRASG